jgi:hypothetical protein
MPSVLPSDEIYWRMTIFLRCCYCKESIPTTLDCERADDFFKKLAFMLSRQNDAQYSQWAAETIEPLSQEGKREYWTEVLRSSRADALVLLGEADLLPKKDWDSKKKALRPSVPLDHASMLPRFLSAWCKLGFPKEYFGSDKIHLLCQVCAAIEEAKSGKPSDEAYIKRLTNTLRGRPPKLKREATPKRPNIEFGEKLKLCRLSAQPRYRSLGAFAEYIGLKKTTYIRLERGFSFSTKPRKKRRDGKEETPTIEILYKAMRSGLLELKRGDVPTQ